MNDAVGGVAGRLSGCEQKEKEAGRACTVGISRVRSGAKEMWIKASPWKER